MGSAVGEDEECYEKLMEGNSLAVWWLGLHVLTAERAGPIPSWEIKSLKAAPSGQEKKLMEPSCSAKGKGGNSLGSWHLGLKNKDSFVGQE